MPPLGRPSSAVKTRPATVWAPNSRKKSGVTCSDGSCSGLSPPVRFITPGRYADASWTVVVCSRQMLNLGTDAPGLVPLGPTFMKLTIRSGSGYGSGLSSTVFTTEKIAVLAPIPSMSAATAAIVNPGVCRNMRSECFRSRKSRP